MDLGELQQNEREKWIFFHQMAQDPVLAGVFSLEPVARARENKKALTQGDSGSAVRELQEQLLFLGYTVTVSGTYDAQTTSAVKAYQTNSSLPATGEADSYTRSAVEKDFLSDGGQSSGGGGFASTATDLLTAGTSFVTGLTSAKPAKTKTKEVELPPEEKGTNWWLIGGVVAGVVLLGGAAVLVFRK